MLRRGIAGAFAVALLLTGCGAADAGSIQLPPPGARFDYQLGGAYPAPDGAAVVARDSTASPAPGAYGICYVNGFQSQPGAVWPRELLVHAASGRLLTDPGWPDEHLFDTSDAAKRAELAARLRPVIQHCASVGYRAVEFDNLDSYSRSHGALTLADAVPFAKLLVSDAHRAGLAAAQKNTAELGARGRDEIGFDFAVTEECDRYSECPSFTRVYGSRVFDIEYTDDLRGTMAAVCARARTAPIAPSTIIRDRDLVQPPSRAHVYTAC
jgi:hypothetical protein